MDLKGVAIFLTSVALENVNSLLTTGGLILNGIYIGYQIFKLYKKGKNE